MKKYLIALGSLVLLAATVNAQATTSKKTTAPVKQEASKANNPAPVKKTTTAPAIKEAPKEGMKRKHHYKKNKIAMKTNAN